MKTTSPPLLPSDPRVPLAFERTFLAWIHTTVGVLTVVYFLPGLRQ